MAEDKDALKLVGVDVGGTNIVAAVVTAGGTVLARKKQDTKRNAPKEEFSPQIVAAIEAALEAAGVGISEIAGIGVAVPGVVDTDTGRIVVLPNLGVTDLPLRDELMEHFPVPVFIGNDVNMGTLAEKWVGAAQDVASVVGVFVGTGIGGGVVIDGKLRTGASEQAGEVGHLTVQIDGPECGCGNRGCWEALASRTAIEKQIRAAIAAGEPSSICPGGECPPVIKSGALKAALAAEDAVVTRVLRRAAEVLGIGAVTIKHLLDPEMIVFGGGVIEALGDFMLPIIEEVVRSDKLAAARDALRIERSQGGDDAVFLGSVALVLSELGIDATAKELLDKPEKPAKGKKKTKPGVKYPAVKGLKFGSVKVEGARYETDVVILADGSVAKRNKKRAKGKYGTSHIIDAEELGTLLEPRPDEVIIGTGMNGAARLAEDGERLLREAGVPWKALLSPEAVELYNQAETKRALLLHVTC